MNNDEKARNRTELEQAVLESLNGLRYGSIEITIHDGRIVQIERREKIRPNESSGELRK